MQKLGSNGVEGEACTVLVQVKLHPSTVRVLSAVQVASGQGLGQLLEVAVDAVVGRWRVEMLHRQRIGDLPEGFDIEAFGSRTSLSNRAGRREFERRMKRKAEGARVR